MCWEKGSNPRRRKRWAPGRLLATAAGACSGTRVCNRHRCTHFWLIWRINCSLTCSAYTCWRRIHLVHLEFVDVGGRRFYYGRVDFCILLSLALASVSQCCSLLKEVSCELFPESNRRSLGTCYCRSVFELYSAASNEVCICISHVDPTGTEQNRFNEVTHETTYTDPDEYGGAVFSPQPCLVDASPVATPFDGSMSPAGYYTGDNGYMSPPVMTPPANGYMSQTGGASMSPNGFHHHQRQQQQQQNDHPMETRSPRFTGGERGDTPHESESTQRQQPQGRGGASTAPFCAGSNTCSGYKWEECYRRTDGKKFWRHKETGVILKKDPYR